MARPEGEQEWARWWAAVTWRDGAFSWVPCAVEGLRFVVRALYVLPLALVAAGVVMLLVRLARPSQ